MASNIFLQVALNGRRAAGTHPALPVTFDNIALDTRAAVAAGAAAVHFHVRDRAGNESLAAEDVARCVEACRRAIASAPLGVSTGAWIVPDVDERLKQIGAWRVLPDFASVNFDEDGAEQVAGLLAERGVGVEVGLTTPEVAEKALSSGWTDRCVRLLIEPKDGDVEMARATTTAIEHILSRISAAVPRLLHGSETTAWALIGEAGQRGYQARIGLEDTLLLPDGEVAESNEQLVSVAIALMAGA